MPASINRLIEWYSASGVGSAVISVSVAELHALSLILTLCLLFRLSRTGLILAFIFVYRWGWIFCRESGVIDPHTRPACAAGYIGFGIIVATLTVIAMIASNRPQGET